MKLSRAVQDFLIDRRASGLTGATLAAYESDLARLAALAAPDSIFALTPDLVRAYFLGLSQQGRKPSTLARKHSSLREFVKWGQKRGLWTSDPLVTIERPRQPDHLPRPFSSTDLAALMALGLPPTEHLVRVLLYYTGLRVSALCQIKLGDCSFAEIRFEDGSHFPGSIRSIGKRGRHVVVPMHPDLKTALFDFAVSRTDMRPASYLLVQRNGRPYRRRQVEAMTRRWGGLAGVDGCVPHRFRHTFATDLLRRGVDIRVIQHLLGHADIKSTMLYTRVADAQLGAAILKLPSWSSTAEAKS